MMVAMHNFRLFLNFQLVLILISNRFLTKKWRIVDARRDEATCEVTSTKWCVLDLEGTRTVAQVDGQYTRWVREGIYIRRSMSMNQGEWRLLTQWNMGWSSGGHFCRWRPFGAKTSSSFIFWWLVKSAFHTYGSVLYIFNKEAVRNF